MEPAPWSIRLDMTAPATPSFATAASELWRCADVVDWDRLHAEASLSWSIAPPWKATAVVASALAPFASAMLLLAGPAAPAWAALPLAFQLAAPILLGTLGAFTVAYAAHGIAFGAARQRLVQAAVLWRRTIEIRACLPPDEAMAAIFALAGLAARDLAIAQGGAGAEINGGAMFHPSLENRMLAKLSFQRVERMDAALNFMRPTGIPWLCARAFSWAHQLCGVSKPPLLISDSARMDKLWREVMPGQAAAFDQRLLADSVPRAAAPLPEGSSRRL